MMRVFPLAAPPMGGVPFSTGKAQPYGHTLLYWPEGTIPLLPKYI